MTDVLEEIRLQGIIPVVVIDDAADAVPLARAVAGGGIRTMEITFRTRAASDAIRAIVDQVPEMLVGAGTVLTIEQADAAIAAGARFVVAPGLNPKVVSHCHERHIPVTPGVATPTEIERALDLGISVLKFFPAESLGGVGYLKAIMAPYRGVRFIPTGGIDERNISNYLSLPPVIACGGSWMVSQALLSAKEFGKVRSLCNSALGTVLGCEVVEFSPGAGAEVLEKQTWDALVELLPGIKRETLVGKGYRRGLTIRTRSLDRLLHHLQRRGISPLPPGMAGTTGSAAAVAIPENICGFPIGIIQQ